MNTRVRSAQSQTIARRHRPDREAHRIGRGDSAETRRRSAACAPRTLLTVGITRRSRRPYGRRRDRRGRGLRGPLFPASLPAASSRSEQFDALVVEVLEPIEARWAEELDKLDVAVDDVPDVRRKAHGEGVLLDGTVPLSRLVPVGVDRNGIPTRARIVLYRRPLEARAKEPEELAELVRDVLIEQVAAYLGIEPDAIEGP